MLSYHLKCQKVIESKHPKIVNTKKEKRNKEQEASRLITSLVGLK